MAEVPFPAQVKSSILTHKSSNKLQVAAGVCLTHLCLDEKYDLLVKVIDRLMALTHDVPSEWIAIRDYGLIQCASERYSIFLCYSNCSYLQEILCCYLLLSYLFDKLIGRRSLAYGVMVDTTNTNRNLNTRPI